jgi:hypothetical protein
MLLPTADPFVDNIYFPNYDAKKLKEMELWFAQMSNFCASAIQ